MALLPHPPAAPATAAPRAAGTAASPGTDRPAHAPAAETILLVEDDARLADLVHGELAAAGYQVVWAPDGPTALQLHARRTPDLVILDWVLPRRDGLAVLRELRRSAVTPVLMLTARAGETDRVLGLEVGADDFLGKPFAMSELLARVRALLRRAAWDRAQRSADASTGREVIARDGIILDPVAWTVSVGGREVAFSPTELSLLHLLLRNPGRAFSRSYLLETVWSERPEAGERAVDNAVLRLRRRLGAAGRPLEAVWGVGYRWRTRSD
jgi:DNA-binding response OmpR family regulator